MRLAARLTAMVWISSIGRHARITAMLVTGCNAGPAITQPSAMPARTTGSDCSHRRGMPVLILSTVASVNSNTLGNRLKCIRGTHNPARAESNSRLRTSVRCG